ncbi:unnamed protein product, partial [Ixodes pacificus]
EPSGPREITTCSAHGLVQTPLFQKETRRHSEGRPDISLSPRVADMTLTKSLPQLPRRQGRPPARALGTKVFFTSHAGKSASTFGSWPPLAAKRKNVRHRAPPKDASGDLAANPRALSAKLLRPSLQTAS